MTHFQCTRVLWTYFIICGEFDLFIKMLKFNDGLEIWWIGQKIHVTLITVLIFIARTYVVPHTCKTSYLELNWFRIYGGGTLSPPPHRPGYLMSKRPFVLGLQQRNIVTFLGNNKHLLYIQIIYFCWRNRLKIILCQEQVIGLQLAKNRKKIQEVSSLLFLELNLEYWNIYNGEKNIWACDCFFLSRDCALKQHLAIRIP